MATLELSPQVFAILSAMVEQECGLHHSPEDREIFADKVSDLVLAAGFDSFLDYYYFVRYDPRGREALEVLIDALVVNESHFFRELPPLRRMLSDLLIPAVARGERPRVWCAACSAGEEPLTLAMLLDAAGIGSRVELVASDISRAALSRAERSVYPARALRDERPSDLLGYVRQLPDGRIAVRDDLRLRIDWRRINLLDAPQVAALGTFDLVICRNVLIYFGDQTIRELLDRLGGALRPGGILLVGVSESLLRFGTALRCEERSGVFLYRKEE